MKVKDFIQLYRNENPKIRIAYPAVDVSNFPTLHHEFLTLQNCCHWNEWYIIGIKHDPRYVQLTVSKD